MYTAAEMCCTRDGSAASFAAANDLYAAADAVEALLYPLDAGDKYRAGRTRTNQWDVEKLPDDQAFALMCGGRVETAGVGAGPDDFRAAPGRQ